MRFAHPTSPAAMMALAALAGIAPPTWAQVDNAPAAPSQTATADSAQAPSLPLHHQPLLPSGDVAEADIGWKAANTAVGAFPGGHSDIVRWEAEQARAAPPSPGMPTPKHHHGGRP